MKMLLASVAVVGLMAASPAAAATYNVDANSPGTPLGLIVAGQTYTFTTTGIVDLVGGAIPDGPFNLDADGVPVTPVTDPNYSYFNPDGSDTADGQYGPGGPGVNFGTLLGTFDNVNYFKIGKNLTTTFATGGLLFGRINDINTNNSGSFNVTINAVPEPATWAMMVGGFALLGGALRSRRRQQVRVTYA